MLEELEGAYKGDRASFSRFPQLRHVMHTGLDYVRGTNKFREIMFYARPSMTNLSLP